MRSYIVKEKHIGKAVSEILCYRQKNLTLYIIGFYPDMTNQYRAQGFEREVREAHQKIIHSSQTRIKLEKTCFALQIPYQEY